MAWCQSSSSEIFYATYDYLQRYLKASDIDTKEFFRNNMDIGSVLLEAAKEAV